MSRYLYLSAIVVTILLFCIVNYPAVFEFYNSPPPPPLVKTSTSVTLIVIDRDGNMGSVSVTTPSLSPILSTALIVCLDGDNLQTVSPGDIYTSYPGKEYRLLICDSTGNFSIISSHSFTPCYVYPNGSINGVPQRDGTCKCNGYWVGATCTSCSHGTTNINGGCHYALQHGAVIRIYAINDFAYGTVARQYLKASTHAMDAPYDKSFVFLGDPDANSQFVWQPTYDDPNNNTKGMLMVKGGAFDSYYAYVPDTSTLSSLDKGWMWLRVSWGPHLTMCLKPNNHRNGDDTTDFQLTSAGRGAYQMSGANGVASKGVPLQIESLRHGNPSTYLLGFTHFLQYGAYREPFYLNIEVQGTDGAFYPIDMIA